MPLPAIATKIIVLILGALVAAFSITALTGPSPIINTAENNTEGLTDVILDAPVLQLWDYIAGGADVLANWATRFITAILNAGLGFAFWLAESLGIQTGTYNPITFPSWFGYLIFLVMIFWFVFRRFNEVAMFVSQNLMILGIIIGIIIFIVILFLLLGLVN